MMNDDEEVGRKGEREREQSEPLALNNTKGHVKREKETAREKRA